MSPKKDAANLAKGDVIVSSSGGRRTVKEVKDFGNRVVVIDSTDAESRHNPGDELEVE